MGVPSIMFTSPTHTVEGVIWHGWGREKLEGSSQNSPYHIYYSSLPACEYLHHTRKWGVSLSFYFRKVHYSIIPRFSSKTITSMAWTLIFQSSVHRIFWLTHKLGVYSTFTALVFHMEWNYFKNQPVIHYLIYWCPEYKGNVLASVCKNLY